MFYYSDITKAILNVLQRLNRPTEVDEIAFRVRSTYTVVKELLDKLLEAHLVTKIDSRYAIADNAKSSILESIYSY